MTLSEALAEIEELRRELAAWRDRPAGGDDLGFFLNSGGWSHGVGEPDEHGDHAAYWVVCVYTDGEITAELWSHGRDMARRLRDQPSIRGAMRAALAEEAQCATG